MIVKFDTKIEDFLASLSQETQELLNDLDADSSPKNVELPELGLVTVYLDACSEGADRGGYVRFIKMHDVKNEKDEVITLEEDCDDNIWLFEGRSSILFNYRG